MNGSSAGTQTIRRRTTANARCPTNAARARRAPTRRKRALSRPCVNVRASSVLSRRASGPNRSTNGPRRSMNARSRASSGPRRRHARSDLPRAKSDHPRRHRVRNVPRRRRNAPRHHRSAKNDAPIRRANMKRLRSRHARATIRHRAVEMSPGCVFGENCSTQRHRDHTEDTEKDRAHISNLKFKSEIAFLCALCAFSVSLC